MDKLLGALASALQLDETEIAALKDGENWVSDDVLAEKLPAVASAKLKAAKEAQLKRGTRETWVSVKKLMKNAGFTPDADAEGATLFEAFAEHLKSQSTPEGGAKPAELSKEELAKLPAVKALLIEARTEVGKKLEDLQGAFDAYKRDTETKEISQSARAYLADAIRNGDVLLSPAGVAVDADERVNLILSSVNFSNLKLVDVKGKKIPVQVDENGEPILDDYGKPVDLAKSVVEQARKVYGPRGQDPNKGGANPKPGSGKAGEYQRVNTFASQADFTAAYSKAATSAERLQIMQDWSHQQKEQAAG